MLFLLSKSKYIYVILLKIVLAYLFSSQYSRDLFLPFVESFSFETPNPWKTYYENGFRDTSPYHGLMLFLLAPFANLGDYIGLSSLFLKIPLLIADISILIILIKILPNSH